MATPRKNWQEEWEKVSAESRKLAKRANQRLVRLERYAELPGMSNILKYSYLNAQQYIQKNLGVSKSGKPRYKEHIKLYDVSDGSKQLKGDELLRANVMIQRQRIKAMQEFLESESSTYGQSRAGKKTEGVKRIYNKRVNTINKKFLSKYGLSMSERDLSRFFASKKQAKLEKLNYNQMFVIAAVIKKENLKSTKREIEKYFKSHIDLSEIQGMKKSDLNFKMGETKQEYLDRLGEFVSFTGDEVLDNYIIQALKEGIDIRNLFE